MALLGEVVTVGAKQYCFVKVDDGPNAFCHASQVIGGSAADMQVGRKCMLYVVWEGGKRQARNVTFLPATTPTTTATTTTPVAGAVRGTILSHNADQTYCFVDVGDGGGNVYCHVSQVLNGPPGFKKGRKCTLTLQVWAGKRQGRQVTLLEEPTELARAPSLHPTAAVHRGTVKVPAGKGACLIWADDRGSDVFCHFSKLNNGGPNDLVPGARCSFDVEPGTKPGSWAACNVTLLGKVVLTDEDKTSTAAGPGPQHGEIATSPGKGFCFIKPDAGGANVFCHYSKLTNGGPDDLKVGTKCTFTVAAVAFVKGKPQASSVTLVLPDAPVPTPPAPGPSPPVIPSTSSSPAAEHPAPAPTWEEWLPDARTWRSYAEADARLLEAALQLGLLSFTTRKLTWNEEAQEVFEFDLVVMAQVNRDTGASTQIRRRDADGKVKAGHTDAEDSGFAADLGFLCAEGPEASAPRHDEPSAAVAAGSAASSSSGPAAPARRPVFSPDLDPDFVAEQKEKGPQSLRSQEREYGPSVGRDMHGTACFDEMLANEKELVGEYVVFYHSYSSAAIIYEVQAAVAAVLFNYRSWQGTLPRLLCHPFKGIPTAQQMLEDWHSWPDRDHNPAFRSVGLCGTCSLLAHDSEAPAKQVFMMGYNVSSVQGVLDMLLNKLGLGTICRSVEALAARFGLGRSSRPGHLLQIFLRRELCDYYAYPSLPYGEPQAKRNRPRFSQYLAESAPVNGQVRLTMNPDVFLDSNRAMLFSFAADPTFHHGRAEFQTALVEMIQEALPTFGARRKAAEAIFGGEPPAWWLLEQEAAGN